MVAARTVSGAWDGVSGQGPENGQRSLGPGGIQVGEAGLNGEEREHCQGPLGWRGGWTLPAWEGKGGPRYPCGFLSVCLWVCFLTGDIELTGNSQPSFAYGKCEWSQRAFGHLVKIEWDTRTGEGDFRSLREVSQPWRMVHGHPRLFTAQTSITQPRVHRACTRGTRLVLFEV